MSNLVYLMTVDGFHKKNQKIMGKLLIKYR
jgi:hypothetical protein